MISHFGLDIGSKVIKIAQLAKEKEGFRLVAAGACAAPAEGFISEADKDLVQVAEAIKKLKKDLKIMTTEVVASIPDRFVFSQVIEVPQMTDDELAQAIPWEAENLVPHPLAEVNLDWKIITDGKSFSSNKMKVLLVAAPSALVNKCLRILRLADLEPVAVETEALAITRCLKPLLGNNNLVIANFGAKSMEIFLVSRGQLLLTRSLPTGGEALSRAVSSSLNLELPSAEEYKKNYGLSGQLEGKVGTVLEPLLASSLSEIKKSIQYFVEKQRSPINLVILNGGSALLPGLTEYLARALGVEVQMADPLSFLTADPKYKENLKPLASFLTVAIGLAMREG